MCMNVYLHVCISVHYMCAWGLWRPEEGTELLELALQSCEPSNLRPSPEW